MEVPILTGQLSMAECKCEMPHQPGSFNMAPLGQKQREQRDKEGRAPLTFYWLIILRWIGSPVLDLLYGTLILVLKYSKCPLFGSQQE